MKNTILGHSHRLKKVLPVLRCAKNTPQRPKKNANLSGLSEKNLYSVESLRICRQGGNFSFGDTKKCCTFSGLELVPRSRKNLNGALSCMHIGPKCIQTLWDHQKKLPFVENYKEFAICAILREQTSFWGIPRGLKRCCACSGARKILPRGPKQMQIPRGYQKKRLFRTKSAILSIRWKFQF